jgi:hypothetical protein
MTTTTMRVLAWDVGIINLAYCLMELIPETKHCIALKWEVINLLESESKDDSSNGKKMKKKTKPGINQLKMLLIQKLDSLKLVDECDIVIIENQPVLKNPTMKSLSGCIYDYFLIRGIIDTNKLRDVKLTSPVNKLKLNVVDMETVDSLKKKYKTRYTFNKHLAIVSCQKLIADTEKVTCKVSNFTENKKKDDLADSFLLAYHYIQEH